MGSPPPNVYSFFLPCNAAGSSLTREIGDMTLGAAVPLSERLEALGLGGLESR